MSLFRFSVLVIAVGLTLFFVWIAIHEASARSVGEVGAILKPFIVLGFTLLAGFLRG